MATANNYNSLKTTSAVLWINDITNGNSYISIGYARPWTDFGYSETVPPMANTSGGSQIEIWNNMVGAKKITGNDVRTVIPKYQWTANTAYVSYDSDNPSLISNTAIFTPGSPYPTGPFYILNSLGSVYKCLDNNSNSPSLVEPTLRDTLNVIVLSDRYVWKYLYTLTVDELYRFTTTSFMPVRTLAADNGNDQWSVQQNAINGSIDVIKILSSGNNYTNSSNLIVTINGNGTGAIGSATVNVSTNTISSIYVLNRGQNYSNASVTISGGGGSGASAKAIISPPGGHGSNPLYELGASDIIISNNIISDENGVLPINFNYRQMAIIRNPLLYGSTSQASNTAYSQTTDALVSGAGVNYNQNEVVYQGLGLYSESFTGRVATYDSSNTKIRLIDTTGYLQSIPLNGVDSTARKTVTSFKLPDLQYYSGTILYSNNFAPINRGINQTENFKIIINF